MPFFSRSGSKKDTIKHKEFVRMYAQRACISEVEASQQINHFIETLYEGIKEYRSITIEHFGNFYISEHRDSVAFRFNPAQKLKAILGWSNTFKGDL